MKIAFMHFWTLRMRRGIETMVLSLANELAEQGEEVSILTARQTQQPLIKASSKVRVKQFPTFRYYQALTIIPFYAADLARNRYDAVVVFFSDFGEPQALRLARPFSKPRLCLYLTFPIESAPHRFDSYRRWGWDKQSTLVLADAQYTVDDGKRFLSREVQLLPSGTDPDRFKPDADLRRVTRQKLGFTEGDVVLLNVAALEMRKGAHRVIESLPDVLAEAPNGHYVILGKGPEREPLEERAQELGIEGHVHFAGTTTELPAFYNAADIFVMLSDSEAGSIACLEAMSSGLPVLVSFTGGFDEVVAPGTGILVDPNDQGAITTAILDLAGNHQKRTTMGAEGRKVVLEHYSWKRIAEQMRQLLYKSSSRGVA